MNQKKTLVLRSRIVLLFAILIASIIVLKICYIQIVIGPELKKKAHRLHFEERILYATRGNILDRNGKILSTTLPYYNIALDPSIIKEDEFFIERIMLLSNKLEEFFQENQSTYYINKLLRLRNEKKKYVRLSKKKISHKDLMFIKSWPIFNIKQFKEGGIIEKTNMRFNPYKGLCLRTIGYCNENNQGVGIEFSLNKYLKGKNGSAIYRKTASGVWHIVNNKITKSLEHGYDVKTTLDIELQDSLNDSLLSVLRTTAANNACAIVMKVESGEILAMVNLSSTTNSPQYTEKYNYAIANQGVREPGSIFKLVSFIALFEETNIELDGLVDTGKGKMQFYDRIMKDVKPGGYGKITVQEVFEKSSNIGVSFLVNQIFSEKPEVFMGYIKRLNLDKASGIEILGEGLPHIPNVKSKKWSKVSLPWISIGYEIELSPLQMLMLYNAIANNGKMVKPMIIKSLYHKNKLIKEFFPKITIRNICSQKTLEKLKIVLEGVIKRGSANKYNDSFYKIAGKSGTANILRDGVYTDDTHVSFVGFFPVENPKYSCIVSMDKENGKDWRYGSHLATIVKDIADKLASTDLNEPSLVITNESGNIKNSNIYPMYISDYNCIIKEITNNKKLKIAFSGEALARYKIHDNKCEYVIINNKEHTVPNLINLRLRDAIYLLDALGMKYEIIGDPHSRVKTQSIHPLSSIAKKQKITLEMF